MVVVEAAAGLTSLKTALDMMKALFDINNASANAGLVLDFKKEMLSAYTDYLALTERNRDLEEKVRNFETWAAEKQRYELKDLWKGFFGYIPKEGMEAGEPPHAICTNCYSKGFKSVLQNSGHITVHDRTWDCPSCKTRIKNQFSDMGQLIAKAREPKPA